MSGTAAPDLPNLLAKVLIEGTHRIIRQGLDRGYIANDEDLPRPRGRIHARVVHQIELLIPRREIRAEEPAICDQDRQNDRNAP